MSIVTIGLPVSRGTFFKIERCTTATGSHFSAADNKAYSHANEAKKEYSTRNNNGKDSVHG